MSRAAAFDALVLQAVAEIEPRWHSELGLVEFAVEETPLVPDEWEASTVPLASVVRGSGARPTRLVLFRKPIELRCEDRADLSALVRSWAASFACSDSSLCDTVLVGSSFSASRDALLRFGFGL